MLNYQALDEAVSARIAPIRQLLPPTIPVSAIAKDAGEIGIDQFEMLTWIFSGYKGSEMRMGTSQTLTMELLFLLSFDDRYDDHPDPDRVAAIEWIEERLLGLMLGYKLPGASSALAIVSGKIFAPESGRWQKEVRFSFDLTIVPDSEIGEIPAPVTRIFGDDAARLFEVSNV